MPKSLTRNELDAAHCATPGCDHTSHDGLILTGACHYGAPTIVTYSKGVLTIECAVCRKFVTRIAVSAGRNTYDDTNAPSERN